MIETALELVKYGMALVPVHYPITEGERVLCSCHKKADCPSKAKHPISSKWAEIAENRVEAIKSWRQAFRADINFGVVTGRKSGVVVLDIDPRHDGESTLDNLQVKYGRLPDTAQVITGSGGSHYYFKAPNEVIKNGTNIGGAGVDFRGDGGFVVAPGSRHASGNIYDWEASSHPEQSGFAELPKWLFDLVWKPPVKQVELNPDSPSKLISEGGRNVFLASIAGSLRNRGLGYRPIMAALHYANLDHCSPPLNNDEVQLIAKSISKYTNNNVGNIL